MESLVNCKILMKIALIKF